MAKVCVVIEHWSNEETCGDCVRDKNVLAVAGNPSTAENIVAGRKKELIDKALEIDSECLVNGSAPHNEKIYDALRLVFSKNYTLSDVAFYWEIEDHKIES